MLGMGRQPLKIGPFGTALVGILEKERPHLNDLGTYTAVGHHLGISRSRVREILEGERPMTFDEFMGLCALWLLDPRQIVREAMTTVFNGDPDARTKDGTPLRVVGSFNFHDSVTSDLLAGHAFWTLWREREERKVNEDGPNRGDG